MFGEIPLGMEEGFSLPNTPLRRGLFLGQGSFFKNQGMNQGTNTAQPLPKLEKGKKPGYCNSFIEYNKEETPQPEDQQKRYQKTPYMGGRQPLPPPPPIPPSSISSKKQLCRIHPEKPSCSRVKMKSNRRTTSPEKYPEN